LMNGSQFPSRLAASKNERRWESVRVIVIETCGGKEEEFVSRQAYILRWRAWEPRTPTNQTM
jgi:hypothetical protein